MQIQKQGKAKAKATATLYPSQVVEALCVLAQMCCSIKRVASLSVVLLVIKRGPFDIPGAVAKTGPFDIPPTPPTTTQTTITTTMAIKAGMRFRLSSMLPKVRPQ